MEYICTIKETLVTKKPILTVKLSNKKPQEASNNSESTQGYSLIKTGDLHIPTSKKDRIHSRKEKKINKQLSIAVPFGDNDLPRNMQNKKLRIGKKIKDRYIVNLLISLQSQ